jgi:hypothetical protein
MIRESFAPLRVTMLSNTVVYWIGRLRHEVTNGCVADESAIVLLGGLLHSLKADLTAIDPITEEEATITQQSINLIDSITEEYRELISAYRSSQQALLDAQRT